MSKMKCIEDIKSFWEKDLIPETNPSQTGLDWFINYFNFISNHDIRKQLGQAYYEARYIYKLMLALKVGDNTPEKDAHIRLQIIHYASIYEAIIDYVLFKVLEPLPQYKQDINILKTFKVYKPIDAMASDVKIIKTENNNDQKLFICKKSRENAPLVTFKSKVDKGVEWNFIKNDDSNYLKNLYNMRNNIHLSKSARNAFRPHIDSTKEAYIKLNEFKEYVVNFINNLNQEMP